jgi:hypothetical protein
MYKETLTHLFYECLCKKQLLFRVQEVLYKVNDQVSVLTCKDVILGYKLDILDTSNLVVNNVLLHYEMFIWNCKSLFVEPTYAKSKDYIERIG